MSDVVRRLQNLHVFRNLSERDLIELASYMDLTYLRHKEMLFEKGQPIKNIYLILSGSVKIQETIPHSETKVFNFLGRGEFLGVAMAGMPNPQYPTSARCNEDSIFLKIPLFFFFNTLMPLPNIRSEVNKQISERFLEFQNDVCKSHCVTPHRIADFLLRLLNRQSPSMQIRIQIPLTRQDIAQRVGAQSETVIRIMSEWTKKGWLKTDDKHIEILNKTALEEIKRDRPPKTTASRACPDSRNVE